MGLLSTLDQTSQPAKLQPSCKRSSGVTMETVDEGGVRCDFFWVLAERSQVLQTWRTDGGDLEREIYLAGRSSPCERDLIATLSNIIFHAACDRGPKKTSIALLKRSILVSCAVSYWENLYSTPAERAKNVHCIVKEVHFCKLLCLILGRPA